MNKYQICFKGLVVNVVCRLKNPKAIYDTIKKNNGIFESNYYFPNHEEIIAIAKLDNDDKLSDEQMQEVLKNIK